MSSPFAPSQQLIEYQHKNDAYPSSPWFRQYEKDRLPVWAVNVRPAKSLSSEMGTTVEPRGCPTPGSCSAVEELADLKQRILPQFQGRTQRAEHERGALLEELIAARKVISEMTNGVATWADAWRESK